MKTKTLEQLFESFEEGSVKDRDCKEKQGVIYYCREFDNYYCPRTCHYAKFKERFEKRRRL